MTTGDSLSDYAARGVLWSAVDRWGARAMSLVVLVVLARNIAPEAFGVVAIVSVALAVLSIVLDQGLKRALVQRTDVEDDHLHSAFWFNVGFAVVLGALLYSMAGTLARWFDEPAVRQATQMLAWAPLLGAFGTVPTALLHRAMDFKSIATRGLISSGAGGVVGIGLALAGYDIEALVGQILAVMAADSIVLWRAAEWRPARTFSLPHLRELLRFGATLFVTDLVGIVNRRSDDTIVGLRLGSDQLGFYAMGYRLFMVLTDLILMPINDVALSAFSKLKDDLDALGQSFLKLIRMSSLIAFPAFLGLSLLAPEIIEVTFGPVWSPAAPVMRLVALVGVIHAVTFFHHTALVAMGQPKVSLGITIAYAVVNVSGFLFAVRYGITAVAAAYALRALVIAPIEAHITARRIGVSIGDYVRSLTPAGVAAVAMSLAVVAIDYALSSTWLTLLVAIPVGVATYVLALRLIAPELVKEARGYLTTALHT